MSNEVKAAFRTSGDDSTLTDLIKSSLEEAPWCTLRDDRLFLNSSKLSQKLKDSFDARLLPLANDLFGKIRPVTGPRYAKIEDDEESELKHGVLEYQPAFGPGSSESLHTAERLHKEVLALRTAVSTERNVRQSLLDCIENILVATETVSKTFSVADFTTAQITCDLKNLSWWNHPPDFFALEQRVENVAQKHSFGKALLEDWVLEGLEQKHWQHVRGYDILNVFLGTRLNSLEEILSHRKNFWQSFSGKLITRLALILSTFGLTRRTETPLFRFKINSVQETARKELSAVAAQLKTLQTYGLTQALEEKLEKIRRLSQLPIEPERDVVDFHPLQSAEKSAAKDLGDFVFLFEKIIAETPLLAYHFNGILASTLTSKKDKTLCFHLSTDLIESRLCRSALGGLPYTYLHHPDSKCILGDTNEEQQVSQPAAHSLEDLLRVVTDNW